VARGYHWRSQLLDGDLGSVSELARKLGLSGRYLIRILRLGFLRLGFLASDLVEAISLRASNQPVLPSSPCAARSLWIGPNSGNSWGFA